MFHQLLKTEDIVIEGHAYPVRYFQDQTLRGLERFSSEVIFGEGDVIIFDADSIGSLEAKVNRLVPAVVYCRVLTSRASAA